MVLNNIGMKTMIDSSKKIKIQSVIKHLKKLKILKERKPDDFYLEKLEENDLANLRWLLKTRHEKS